MSFDALEWGFFEDYECEEFVFMGQPAKIVKPHGKPNGKWALKTEYFGSFPTLEMELLDRGWHIAFNQNDNRWAEPQDIKRKAAFIRYISKTYNLFEKCAVVGLSCGGLYGVKLAAWCPELISVLYLDAPVMNLLSFPAAFGVAKKSYYDEYQRFTGRTISELLSYREHPIDKMDILLKNNIPVILVAGDSDESVPYCENGALLENYYKENGGTIEVYIKSGCGHHPHGLENPGIIADFMDKYK